MQLHQLPHSRSSLLPRNLAISDGQLCLPKRMPIRSLIWTKTNSSRGTRRYHNRALVLALMQHIACTQAADLSGGLTLLIRPRRFKAIGCLQGCRLSYGTEEVSRHSDGKDGKRWIASFVRHVRQLMHGVERVTVDGKSHICNHEALTHVLTVQEVPKSILCDVTIAIAEMLMSMPAAQGLSEYRALHRTLSNTPCQVSSS